MMDGIADRRTFGAGDTIFREGDRGEGIYLVEKGSVEIFKKAPDGRKIVIGKIQAGGIFGEMAAIDERPRMASAAAMEHTVCRIIPRAVLEKKIAASDKLVRAIMKIFMQNIRSITEMHIKNAMKEAGADGAAPAVSAPATAPAAAPAAGAPAAAAPAAAPAEAKPAG
jgi:CRP/FNR family cyclic AMP-dependent transcriptional regulator